MRISPQLDARWATEQRNGQRTRILELIDLSVAPVNRIEVNERGARMLAALIHQEFQERKTGGEKK